MRVGRSAVISTAANAGSLLLSGCVLLHAARHLNFPPRASWNSPSMHSVKQAPVEFEFKADVDGKITGLVMIQNGSEKPAKKIK
jgi:hypothetical protein